MSDPDRQEDLFDYGGYQQESTSAFDFNRYTAPETTTPVEFPEEPPAPMGFEEKVKGFEMMIGPDEAAKYRAMPHLQYMFSPNEEEQLTPEQLDAMMPAMKRWVGADSGEQFFDSLKTGWQDMQLGYNAAQVGYDLVGAIMSGNEERQEELIAQAQEYLSQRTGTAENPGFWEKLGNGLGQSTGLMARTVYEGLPEAAGAAAGIAAGTWVAGKFIPGPEEAITVPAMGLGALTLAVKAGSMLEMTKFAIGDTVVGLIEKGIDPRVAAGVGIPFGAAVGMIEYSQFDELFKLLPGGAQGFLGIIRGVASRVGTELFEEGAQEATTIVAENIGAALSNTFNMTNVPVTTWGPAVRRVVDAMKEAAYSVGAMGAVSGVTAGTIQNVQVEKVPQSEQWEQEDMTDEERLFTPEGISQEDRAEIESEEPTPEEVADDAEFEQVTPEARRAVLAEPEENAPETGAEEETGSPAEPEPEESVELRRRFLSGQVKWSELPETAQEFIQERGQAAPATQQRETFTAGKREKASQVKAQREAQKMRQYFLKTAKFISKDRTSAPIAINQKRQIQLLQEGIEPRFFSAKTLEKNDALRKYLEAHPEAVDTIPKKLLEKAMNRPLNDFTIAELEERAEQIKELEREGRLIQKLRMRQQAKKEERRDNMLAETVLQGEPLEAPGMRGGALDETQHVGKIEALQTTALNAQRLLDIVDGGQDFQGPAHNIFWNRAMDIVDEQLTRRKEVFDSRDEARKQYDINPKRIAKPIEKNSKFTRENVMGMYAALQNEHATAVMVRRNGIPVREAERLVEKLTQDEKGYVDWMIERGHGDRAQELNDAFVEYQTAKGAPADMIFEPRYSPIMPDSRYLTQIEGGTYEDIAGEIARRQGIKKAYQEKGFTKERVDEVKIGGAPMRLDIDHVFTEHVVKREAFIANAKVLRDMQRALAGKKFQSAIAQKYGIEYIDRIQEWVNTIADPHFYSNMNKSAGLWRKVISYARKNRGGGALAFNIRTWLYQPVSMLAMMSEAGPINFMKGLYESITDPIGVFMKMQEEPQIRERSLDRLQEEWRKTDPKLYDKIMSAVGKAGFAGIQVLDRVGITPGWVGVYKRFKSQGYSEQDARREATNAVLRTQPVGKAKDVAGMYRTEDELIAGLLQFTSQRNQLWGIVTHDIPSRYRQAWKALKHGEFGEAGSKALAASIALGAVGANAFVLWTIAHGRPPKDEKDLKDLTGQFASYVPMFGSAMATAIQGYDDQGQPIEALVNAAMKAVAGNQSSRVTDELLMLSLRLPMVQYRRVKKFTSTGKLEDLFGIKP